MWIKEQYDSGKWPPFTKRHLTILLLPLYRSVLILAGRMLIESSQIKKKKKETGELENYNQHFETCHWVLREPRKTLENIHKDFAPWSQQLSQGRARTENQERRDFESSASLPYKTPHPYFMESLHLLWYAACLLDFQLGYWKWLNFKSVSEAILKWTDLFSDGSHK